MILVVDDDADIREAVGLFLQADGYRIGRASNGKEAMAWLLSREAPGVILLDLTMPIMDGQQFLTIKEADPALANIPVVVMTAVSDCSQLMIDHQVSECLAKPASPGALLDALERARAGKGRPIVTERFEVEEITGQEANSSRARFRG